MDAVSSATFPVQPDDASELAEDLDVAPRAYGPRLRAGEARVCSKCGRTIDPQVKRHTCPVCAIRKCRGLVPGPACEVCTHTDARVLRLLRLADGTYTTCGNCSAIAGRRALSLEQLRAEALVVAA